MRCTSSGVISDHCPSTSSRTQYQYTKNMGARIGKMLTLGAMARPRNRPSIPESSSRLRSSIRHMAQKLARVKSTEKVSGRKKWLFWMWITDSAVNPAASRPTPVP